MNGSVAVEKAPRRFLRPLIFLSFSFFTWGCLTSFNSVLVPYFKNLFDLSYQQSMLVNVCFYLAPLISCIPCSALMNRIGYAHSLRTAIAIALTGCILLFAAMSMTSFTFTLLAIFIIAIGVATMQVVANPFVTLLGDEHSAAGRLTLASAINSIGTTIAPIIVGVVIGAIVLSDTVQLSGAIGHLYLIAGAILLLLFISFSRWKLPNFKIEPKQAQQGGHWRQLVTQTHFLIGVVAIFIYVGVEVSIGTLAINYLSSDGLGGLSSQSATSLIAIYWGGSLAGRLIFGAIAHKLRVSRALMVTTCLSLLLVISAIVQANLWGGLGLLVIGLMNSLMYPVIFSRSLVNLGENTGLASAIMIMAGVGGGIWPMLQATLADAFGLRLSFIVPACGYFLLFIYSLYIQRTEYQVSEVIEER